MDMLMRAVRDALPEATVVFQNIFRFDTSKYGGSVDSEYHKEFLQWRMDLLKQYAPQANGKMDTHAFEAFIPEWAKQSISKIAFHLNIMYPSYAFRIMALCNDENDELIFEKLQKFCRVYTGNTDGESGNSIGIQYLTATHQEYKNEKEAGNPKFQNIYNTFVFPDWFGDQFEAMIAPWYEKYYYPNENLYRQKVIYKTTIKRDLNAPWNGDWNLTEGMGMSGFFQFPSRSSEPIPLQMLNGSATLDTHKSVFRDAYK